MFFLQCSCKAVGVKDSQSQGNGRILIPTAQFSPRMVSFEIFLFNVGIQQFDYDVPFKKMFILVRVC